ncbi:DUF4190 domain-containing protein [Streptomyces sp. NPDC048442]|uniref:DUF4190 domain-containing protein n=1 Tax=Streptomyces sp. NPDC048442 TaxID=3154823 RepID=UPI003432E949
MSQYSNQPSYPQAPSQQYPPQGGGHGAPRTARNGLGTAALILGIIGSLSGLVPLLFWLAGILGLIALVLGLTGAGRVKRGEATNKGVALTGAVLGLASLVLSVVGAVLLFKAVDDGIKEVDKALSGQEPVKKDAGKGAAAAGSDKAADKEGAKDGTKDGAKALAAGEAAEYEDKLTVTVSAPAKYTPGEYAAGHTKGNKARLVTVVINNAGTEKFDAALVTATARAGQDGTEAEQIIDDKVGLGFSGTVMPGKKVTVKYAFDVPADAKNLTVEVTPDFTRKSGVWDLKL